MTFIRRLQIQTGLLNSLQALNSPKCRKLQWQILVRSVRPWLRYPSCMAQYATTLQRTAWVVIPPLLTPGRGHLKDTRWLTLVLSSPNRAMQVSNAMCFCKPRCESRDFKGLDGTETSDLCSSMCISDKTSAFAMDSPEATWIAAWRISYRVTGKFYITVLDFLGNNFGIALHWGSNF